MTIREVLEYIAEGHSLWSVDLAKEICKTLNVPFKNRLIITWNSQKDANPTNDFKGLWLNEDKPGQGVASDRLSSYVVNYLCLKPKSFFGRGSQARENARVLKEYLKGKE